jgi:hypothetical protein
MRKAKRRLAATPAETTRRRSGTGQLRRRSGLSGAKPESGSSSGRWRQGSGRLVTRTMVARTEATVATNSTLARRSDGAAEMEMGLEEEEEGWKGRCCPRCSPPSPLP